MRRYFRNTDKYNIICGITGALLTLISGFTVMYLFWINDVQNPNLRGFFSYKAATFGDGICLPFLVGCSLVCILYGQREKFRFCRPCIFIGLIGAIVGAIVQASWIISDKTLLNWTIPKLHYFTAAGYYHGVFFVLMFGYIGFALSSIWSLRRKNTFTFKQEICFWGIISSGSGFLYCLALDDWTVHDTAFRALLKAFLLVFLGMMLYSCSSSFKRIKRDFGIIVSAECFSLGIVITALNHGTNIYFIFFGAAEALFSIILIKPQLKLFTKQLFFFLMVGCPLFSLNVALYSSYQIDNLLFYILFIVLIVMDILIANCLRTYDNLPKECIPLLALIPIYLFIIVAFEKVDDNALETLREIADGVAALGIYFILKFYIQKNLFCIIQKTDENMTLSKSQDKKIKLSVYFNIMIVLIGAILFFYNVMIISFDDIHNSALLDNYIIECMINCILILLCSIICTMILRKIPYPQLQKILSLLGMGTYYSLLVWNTFRLCDSFHFKWGILLIFFPTIGASWMAAKGYYNNLLGLRGIENRKIDRISQGIIFIGNTICSLALANIIFSTSSNIDASLLFLISIVVLLMGFVIGPTISGTINKYPYIDTGFIRAEPYVGIAQDGFTSLLIIMLAGMIPMHYYRQLLSQGVITQIIGFSGGIVAIIVVIYWPYRYCLENNIKHYKVKCKEYEHLILQHPDYKKLLDYQKQVLKEHLMFQNKFSYIAVLPYLLIWDCLRIILNRYGEKMELFWNLAFNGISDEKED